MFPPWCKAAENVIRTGVNWGLPLPYDSAPHSHRVARSTGGVGDPPGPSGPSGGGPLAGACWAILEADALREHHAKQKLLELPATITERGLSSRKKGSWGGRGRKERDMAHFNLKKIPHSDCDTLPFAEIPLPRQHSH